MFGRKRARHEAKAAEIGVLVDRIQELERTQAARGREHRGLTGALIATSQLDGRFQFADALVIGASVIVAGCCGTLAAFAIGLFTTSFMAFKIAVTTVWVLSGLVGMLVLLLELLGFQWPWLNSPHVDSPPEVETIEHEIVINVQHDKGHGPVKVNRLIIEPEDYNRVVSFAREALALRARGEPAPTTEKHWIGKGKLWSNGRGDRANFARLRDQLISAELAVASKQGWELVSDGWDTLENIAKLRRH